MTKDTALDLALEALRSAAAELYIASSYCNTYEVLGSTNDAIIAIQQALAAQPEPVQEPVAWMFEDDEDDGHKTFIQTPPSPKAVAYLAKWNRPAWVPLYTTPPAAQLAPVKVQAVPDGYVPISDDLKSVFIEGCGEIQLAWPTAQPAPVQEEDLYDLAVKADNGGQP